MSPQIPLRIPLDVVVVDDNEPLMRFLVRSISRTFEDGCNVEGYTNANDGYEAVRRLSGKEGSEGMGVVLCTDNDIVSRNEGINLVMKLRKEGYTRVHVILSSARPMEMEALTSGANKFFEKPYTPNEVTDYIVEQFGKND
mgnify:CR=1 FL=1